MKGRHLSALSALALVVACQDQKVPTALTGRSAPGNPSAMISDGAHGGNPDFFFLPPLVSSPANDPTNGYEPGKANTALEGSLTVKICELNAAATDCAVGIRLVKEFPAGTVRLQGSGDDGFYMAQWKTQESPLVDTKFYRIEVFIEGLPDPLGFADVDPVSNMKEFKNVRTGEVIPLLDDATLPIKFRVEKNGSPCPLTAANPCVEHIVTNAGGTITVPGGAGALAGADFPPGWLPTGPGLPTQVLVAITQVNTGPTNEDGTQSIPCHRNLPLEQFYSCFKFTTYPKLGPNSTNFPGHQFQQPVITAVCWVGINNRADPRREWVQLWASDDGANLRALPDAADAGILGPDARNCNTTPPEIIGDNSTVRGLASTGWRKLKGTLGQIFGVQTAYAVDLGLGGSTLDFSNISPAMTAQIQNAGLSGDGRTDTARVQILGISHHGGLNAGVNGIPVTFTVDSTSGNFGRDVETGAAITERIVYTSTLYVEGPDGIASVEWTVLPAAGPHTMTANGPALGGPITFTVVVPPPIT